MNCNNKCFRLILCDTLPLPPANSCPSSFTSPLPLLCLHDPTVTPCYTKCILCNNRSGLQRPQRHHMQTISTVNGKLGLLVFLVSDSSGDC